MEHYKVLHFLPVCVLRHTQNAWMTDVSFFSMKAKVN